MKTIEITTPDGNIIELTAPDDATPEMIQEKAMQAKSMYMSQMSKNNVPQEQPSAINKVLGRVKQEFQDPTNYIPGLKPALVGAKTLGQVMEKSQEGYDLMGEKAAEAIDQEGKHPYISAAVGGTIQNIPNIVNAAQAYQATPAIANALRAIPGAAKSVGANLSTRLKNTLDILKAGNVQEAKDELNSLVNQFNLEKPAQSKAGQLAQRGTERLNETISRGRERLQEIPEQFRDKATSLESLKSATKKEFGAVENEMGIGFKSGEQFEQFVGNKAKMGKFLEKAERLASKGPDKIAKEVNPSTIQLYRKIAQEGKGSLSDMGRAQLEGYRETFAKSLEQVNGKFKDVRKRLADVNSAIDDLPKAEKAAKEATRRQIVRAQAELKKHQTEMNELMAEAKKADKQQLNDIKRRALVKVRQAAQKERLIKTLKYSALAAGGLTYLKGKI